MHSATRSTPRTILLITFQSLAPHPTDAYNLSMANKDDQLEKKLRRLGVVKGARKLKPAPPPDPSLLKPIVKPQPRFDVPDVDDDFPIEIETLVPGLHLQETAVGACMIIDKVYPLHYRHGDDVLQDLFAYSPNITAAITENEQFNSIEYRDLLFIDTETTGLAGAGTLAFMVGVAFFEEDALIVRQFFLRDHGDEAAMLTLLDDLLAQKEGLVSFNGRTFDVPLLDGRFLMNRMLTDIRDKPHFDLLPPSRRLWRYRLSSCALSNLEPKILGVHRTQEDVPGWLIPSLYNNYLRNGNGRELARVFYHNQLDMVSMVTLMARILRQFSQPVTTDHPIDLYSLGKWQAKMGIVDEAEQNLRLAAQGDLPLDMYHQNLHELGLLLKRNGRRAEAVPMWQQIAATSFDDVTAHVELAKFYEWHEPDLPQAILWTEQAIKLSQSWGSRAELVQDDLAHRLNRLQRKNDEL